jgi:stearoyl-CoA desaturase (delta-9 desaturase)
VVDWDDFVAEAKSGKALIAVAGVIHDVSDFVKDHPGGRTLITSAIGKDATAIFNGGVYNHSNAAHNLLSTMRVSVIRGGCEVEIWKRAQKENKDVEYVRDDNGQRIVRAGYQVTKIPEPIPTAGAA